MNGTRKVIVLYAAMILASIAIFLLIRHNGEMLTAPAPSEGTAATAVARAAPDALWHLLLALAAVVTVGRLLGTLFRHLGQPPVIGEVIGGIVLGPSLLGLVAPNVYQYLLPSTVAPYLGVISQLGVIIYMFLVGLELNPELIRRRAHATVATSHASIVVPFLLGAGLALHLYPRFSTSNVPFTSFALFLGLAMSITAFPVLARILSDSRITQSELGMIALTCAAVDDVTAWCLLAFVVGVVQNSPQSALLVALLTLGFIALMFGIVRPIASRITRPPDQGTIAFSLVALFASALTTEAIGIHAIFGAFLLGAVIPHDSRLARALKESLENLVTILLLPAFFAFTGMRTKIDLVSGPYEWLICGLIIVVATAGKFGGTFLAGRLTGLDWRRAAGLGVLMNTRGLMELIALNVGLELGVISQTLFTMMVLMALVTTIATTPILHRLIAARDVVVLPSGVEARSD